MNLNINDAYFGELLPFIKDDSITDITWNGRDLWLDDLQRGRYKSKVKLSDQFVTTFATRIANLANKNFNLSEPLLEAETDNLRISIVDNTVTNTNRSIAIRKTPAVRRLNELKMLESGYAEAMVLKLLKVLVKGHSSVIVTGDVGSGKTELVKYLTKFIPQYERTISIEDNYELRLSAINPNLDCVEIKATQDGPFSYQDAIKAALRQLCKWLLMAEARSKEVVQLLEAASTGCIVMTTLHSDDVRKIPDRVVNMMGTDGEEKRNDVYNFFDVGIKVGIVKTDQGIKRSIDQICVLDRDNNENALYLIYNKGFTGQTLPRNLWRKVEEGAKEELALFEFLKPDNADVGNITETPEFAQLVQDIEASMKEELIEESVAEEKAQYDDSDTIDIDDFLVMFDEAEKESSLDDLAKSGVVETLAKDEPEEEPESNHEEENEVETFDINDYLIDDPSEVTPVEEVVVEEPVEELEPIEIPKPVEVPELILEEPIVEEPPLDKEALLAELSGVFDEDKVEIATRSESFEDIDDILNIFDQIGFELDGLENLTKEELIRELRKQMALNWFNSLDQDGIVEALKEKIVLIEMSQKTGEPIPELERFKILLLMGKKDL